MLPAAFLAPDATSLPVEPERAPELTAILDAVNAGWRRHAGCAGDEDANWFPDPVSQRYERFLGSPTVLLPLLICAGCPVRVDCLREGVEEWQVSKRDDGHADVLRSQIHAVGVWGGTLDVDRLAVRHLPPADAVRELERTFPARLRVRVAAFRRDQSRPGRYGRRTRLRILNLLEAGPLAVTAAPTTRRRRCAGCRERLHILARSDARYCSVRCRVAAYRVRAAA